LWIYNKKIYFSPKYFLIKLFWKKFIGKKQKKIGNIGDKPGFKILILSLFFFVFKFFF
jgi:hypothetical protein